MRSGSGWWAPGLYARCRARGAADFFYNLMWRAYGHLLDSDAGAATHYWMGANARELGWHMLDQVVLRPEESPRFPEHQNRLEVRLDVPILLGQLAEIALEFGSECDLHAGAGGSLDIDSLPETFERRRLAGLGFFPAPSKALPPPA